MVLIPHGFREIRNSRRVRLVNPSVSRMLLTDMDMYIILELSHSDVTPRLSKMTRKRDQNIIEPLAAGDSASLESAALRHWSGFSRCFNQPPI
jgi:hypothetical protein